jgi:hypothetical protein
VVRRGRKIADRAREIADLDNEGQRKPATKAVCL